MENRGSAISVSIAIVAWQSTIPHFPSFAQRALHDFTNRNRMKEEKVKRKPMQGDAATHPHPPIKPIGKGKRKRKEALGPREKSEKKRVKSMHVAEEEDPESFPYSTDYGDHFETSVDALLDIEPALYRYNKALQPASIQCSELHLGSQSFQACNTSRQKEGRTHRV
jgi:hypothetical protein